MKKVLKTFLIFCAGFFWLTISARFRFFAFISFIPLVILIIFAVKKDLLPINFRNNFKRVISDKVAFTGYFCLFSLSTCFYMIESKPKIQRDKNQEQISEVQPFIAKKHKLSNKGIIKKQPIINNPIKLINYKIFEKEDHQSRLYGNDYHWIQARITTLKVGIYKPEQIKETMKDSVLKLRIIYPKSNLITVWFYDRENDLKNGTPFTLGMVDWVPEKSSPGILEPEKYDYSNKNNYKYVYSVCKKGEFKIPSEKAYKVYDFFFQTRAKNENLSEDELDRITEKKFKLTNKQFNELFQEVNFFNFCFRI